MGVFDNLSNTEVFEKSQFFQPGKYVVEILKCIHKDGYRGESFIIECEVLGVESSDPDAPEVGSRAAHIWKVSGKPDVARSTLMQFLCALTGKRPKDMSDAKWAKLASKVFSDANGAKGYVMRLDCHMTKTNAGNDFTVHTWLGEADDDDLERFGVDAA